MKEIWKRLKNVLLANLSLVAIVAAALLLELTSTVMYFFTQNIIQRTMERLVQTEMNAIYLCIQNKLARVEVTVDNTAWVVEGNLSNPDAMFNTTRQLVENNPNILGSSITFIPDYYPQKGRWFEAYTVRRGNNTIETMQLGSANHDYTTSEFFTQPIAKDSGHWSEPYMDREGARTVVTTYGAPVHDAKGKAVAVVDADLSLEWLEDILNETKVYKSTERFLITPSGHLMAGNDNATFKMAMEQVDDKENKTGYVYVKDESDNRKHIFFHPVGGKTSWILISVLDDQEVFGKLRSKRTTLLWMTLSGLFFIGFIVYRASRNLERLRQMNAEKARIESELRVANQIQQSMLPHHHLISEDADIYASLTPAREVGGDLYDYFLRDEKLFFCIGDVSGKGTPSAMLMASTRSLFRAFSAHENNPARIMQSINEAACQNNDTYMFTTFFIGVLDLPTGRLRYCNAGHDTPLVTDADIQELQCDANLPLGVFDDIKYTLQQTHLPTGGTLFLYTDGLTEAMNVSRRQFGLPRIKETLNQCKQMTPKEVTGTMKAAVQNFVNGAEQSDDLTLLVIHYTPQHFNSIIDETLTLKNDIAEVDKLSEFQKTVYEKMGMEKSLSRQMQLAVEEAVVNVIDYAYTKGTEGIIEVNIMSDGHRMKVRIMDSGVPFDPTAKEKADTSLSAEDRQIGGLGILLVRELMDAINYEHADGKNILTLTKIIDNTDKT